MKKISQRVADVIAKGTPTLKATLVLIENIDKVEQNKEPTITDEEVDAIKESITEEKDKRAYTKLVMCYYVYRSLMSKFGTYQLRFREYANYMLFCLERLRSLTLQVNNLNFVISELMQQGNEQGLEAVYKSLQHFKAEGATLSIDEDGFIKADLKTAQEDSIPIYEDIEFVKGKLKWALSLMKGAIIVVEEWTAKKKSKAVMPPMMANAIRQTKGDYIASILSPDYSERVLNQRRAKGERITEQDIQKAAYPDYELIEPSPIAIDIFKRLIEYNEREYKKQCEASLR